MLGSLPRHLVLSLHLPRPKGSVRFGRDDDEAKEERKEPRKRRDEPNRGKTRVNILSFGDGTERSEWWDERRMECLLVSFPSSPHVSFHYVPEPQAEDGNTGGTNREWGVKGVANGTNRACSPPHFPTFLSSVTHVPSSSYRCASGTERSEVEGSERRVTRVRHER